MTKYIAVNTMHGYLMEHGGVVSFTHDIADATVSTNYGRIYDLAREYFCTIWAQEDDGKWYQHSEPSHIFDPSEAAKLLKEVFRHGTD